MGKVKFVQSWRKLSEWDRTKCYVFAMRYQTLLKKKFWKLINSKSIKSQKTRAVFQKTLHGAYRNYHGADFSWTTLIRLISKMEYQVDGFHQGTWGQYASQLHFWKNRSQKYELGKELHLKKHRGSPGPISVVKVVFT